MPSESRSTETLHVDPDSPAAEAVERAARLLRAGSLVAIPTETVYGLAAHALETEAVARIFQAKGRPANNPVIVHVLGAAEARELSFGWNALADRLAAEFWPGPLTLVLPKTDRIPSIVTAGGKTVALRAPSHPVARAILAASKLPLAAPSANRSNHLSPTTAGHVLLDLRGRIDLIVDAGPCQFGVESTVVDLSGDRPRLLRPGGIGVEALRSMAPDLEVPDAETLTPNRAAQPPGAPTTPLPSPGMLPRHYAPAAPLELLPAAAARARAHQLAQSHLVGWLHYESEPATDSPPVKPDHGGARMIVRTLPRDAAGYAARLFAALHDFERHGCERIVATIPPADEAWRAVRDRLARAATPPE